MSVDPDVVEEVAVLERDALRWRENAPFWIVHAIALGGAIYVGWSARALWWMLGTYLVHIFAVTGVYHRYFSHRTYKTSRWFQFVLAAVGVTAVQKGPLWWAAHHRHHHKYSDEPQDVHSPRQKGFWFSHMFWILMKRFRATNMSAIKDFAKYPELVWLNQHEMKIVAVYATALYFIGGPVALIYGFFVSTVLCWHATFTINSLAHVWGGRRYKTTDDSRNNFFLALITLGEGWHNNHHHYQRATRQGFFWYEIDVTYYILRGLQAVRLVSDVTGVPTHVRDDESALERPRNRTLAAAIDPPTV